MPLGLFGGNSPARFSKKKTYSVRHDEEKSIASRFRSNSTVSRRRRDSAPAGILKKIGRNRPISYPALTDGMVPQEMAAAVPMPSEPELDAMFSQMVVSCLYRPPIVGVALFSAAICFPNSCTLCIGRARFE